MSTYPPLSEPWEFPNFGQWLAPFIVTVVLWFLLLIEHILYLGEDALRWEVRFQALYVRMVFVFPVFSALTLTSAAFPWLSHWFDLIGVFLEAYVLFGFYAFLTGLAFLKSPPGVFPENLISEEQKWTNKPFRCCGGRRFRTGQGALQFFFYSIAQFVVIKPSLLLVTAVVFHQTGHEPEQKAKIVMNLFSSISVFVATLAVLRLYKGLKDQPNSVMDGHNGLLKIGVVKLLFIFVVLNNLILRNLAAADKLPIPPGVCIPSVVLIHREYCELRVINVVFLMEIVLCVIPAVISYRHHGLGLSSSRTTGNNNKSRQYNNNKTNILRFLCLVFCRPFDLNQFWNGQLSAHHNATGIGSPASSSGEDERVGETDLLPISNHQLLFDITKATTMSEEASSSRIRRESSILETDIV